MDATPQDIMYIRDLIDEIDDSTGWTDERITLYINRSPNLFSAAAEIWTVKAGSYSSLVDVSESGSSRRLSGLLANALNLAKFYRERGQQQEDTDTQVSAPFTVPIRRG